MGLHRVACHQADHLSLSPGAAFCGCLAICFFPLWTLTGWCSILWITLAFSFPGYFANTAGGAAGALLPGGPLATDLSLGGGLIEGFSRAFIWVAGLASFVDINAFS